MHISNPKSWGAGTQEYHEKNYGPIEEFGYHDFIPMFTAEHFDPEEWADLFQLAGARFAGPVAQHHDGFSMWDSKVNPNNAKAEGPRRDVTGELLAALRKRKMKTITTFHHSFTGQRQRDGQPEDERPLSYYRFDRDLFTSSEDPKLRKLYGNMPEKEFNDYWLSVVQEVVDKYEPGAAITVKHLADGENADLTVEDVTQLGTDAKCDWTFESGVLNLVAPPVTDSNTIATVFKVQFK